MQRSLQMPIKMTVYDVYIYMFIFYSIRKSLLYPMNKKFYVSITEQQER